MDTPAQVQSEPDITGQFEQSASQEPDLTGQFDKPVPIEETLRSPVGPGSVGYRPPPTYRPAYEDIPTDPNTAYPGTHRPLTATGAARRAAGVSVAPPAAPLPGLDPYAFEPQRVAGKSGRLYREKAVPEAEGWSDPLIHIAAGAEPIATGLSRMAENPAQRVIPNPHIPPSVLPLSPAEQQEAQRRERQRMLGAAEVLQGAGQLGTVALPASLATAPLRTAAGLGAGYLASEAGGAAAHAVGAGPEAEEFVRQLAFFAPSAIGVLSGLRSGTIETPQGRFSAASVFGGRARAGVATTPEAFDVRAQVGGTTASIRIPRPGAAPAPEPSAAAKMLGEFEQGAGQTPTPPPPPQSVPYQGPDHLTPEAAHAVTDMIMQAPAAERPKLMLEAHQNMVRWMLGRGTFTGPDGRIHTVDNEGQAKKLASQFINDQVDAQDKAQEEAAKAAAKAQAETTSRPAKAAAAKVPAGAPATAQPATQAAPLTSEAASIPPMGHGMTTDSPVVAKVHQEADIAPGQEPLVMVKKETPEDARALAQAPEPVPPADLKKIGQEDESSGRTIVQPSDDVLQNERLAAAAAPELATKLSEISASVPGAKFDRMRPQKNLERITEKEDADKPPETIADYLAAQIAADSPQAKDSLIAELQKNFNVLSVEDNFTTGDPKLQKYPSTKVQVQLSNGSTSEVQIVPTEMQAVTDHAHHFYSEGRKAEVAGDTAKRDEMWAQSEKINTQALEQAKANWKAQGWKEPAGVSKEPDLVSQITGQQPHEFSSTQINIAPESALGKAHAQAVAAIPEEHIGKEGRETTPHVTIRYGLKDDSPEAIEKIKEAAAEIEPFEVPVGKTDIFPASEHSGNDNPVIARLETTPELKALREAIEGAGAFKEDNFPTYEPHVTLAYVKPEFAEQYKGGDQLEGQKVPVNEVTVSKRDGSQEVIKLGRGTESVSIPLEDLPPAPPLLRRILNRLKGSHGIDFHYTAPAEGRPPVIDLSKKASQIVKKSLGLHEATRGVSMHPLSTFGLNIDLDNLIDKEASPERRKALESLKNVFHKASYDAGHAGIVTIFDRAAQETKDEEMFHAAQRVVGEGRTSETLSPESVSVLLDHPVGKKAADFLKRSEIYRKNKPSELVAEIAAKIASLHPYLMKKLTPEEAGDWFTEYLDHLVKASNAESVGQMRQFLNEKAVALFEESYGKATKRGEEQGSIHDQETGRGVREQPEETPQEGTSGGVAPKPEVEPDLPAQLPAQAPTETKPAVSPAREAIRARVERAKAKKQAETHPVGGAPAEEKAPAIKQFDQAIAHIGAEVKTGQPSYAMRQKIKKATELKPANDQELQGKFQGADYQREYFKAALQPAADAWKEAMENAPTVEFGKRATHLGRGQIAAYRGDQLGTRLTLRENKNGEWDIVYEGYVSGTAKSGPGAMVSIKQTMEQGLPLQTAKKIAEERLQTGNLYDKGEPFLDSMNREVKDRPLAEPEPIRPKGFSKDQLYIKVPDDGHFLINNRPYAIGKALAGADEGFRPPKAEPAAAMRVPKSPKEFDNEKYISGLEREIADLEDKVAKAERDRDANWGHLNEQLKAARENLAEAQAAGSPENRPAEGTDKPLLSREEVSQTAEQHDLAEYVKDINEAAAKNYRPLNIPPIFREDKSESDVFWRRLLKEYKSSPQFRNLYDGAKLFTSNNVPLSDLSRGIIGLPRRWSAPGDTEMMAAPVDGMDGSKVIGFSEQDNVSVDRLQPMAAALMDAVHYAPPEDLDLYRGLKFGDTGGSAIRRTTLPEEDSGQWFVNAKPGVEFTLPLSSFSDSMKEGVRWASKLKHGEGGQYVPDPSGGVLLKLEGPTKSLAMSMFTGIGEREHMTQGTFRVVSNAVDGKGLRTVTIRQISTFDGQGQAAELGTGRPLLSREQPSRQTDDDPDVLLSREAASRQTAATFFSKAERVASEKLPKNAAASSVLSTLRNAGVKEEELKWIGLDDWLKDRKMVSKQEVLDFIQQNNVQVQEVKKGKEVDPQRVSEAQQRVKEIEDQIAQVHADDRRKGTKLGDRVSTWGPVGDGEYGGLVYEATVSAADRGRMYWNKVGEFGPRSPVNARPGFVNEVKAVAPYPWMSFIVQGELTDNSVSLIDQQWHELTEARRALEEAEAGSGESTHFKEHQLPGGGNYKELLLTLAARGASRIDELQKQISDFAPIFERGITQGERDSYAELTRELSRLQSESTGGFRSSHFDEPNILAHVRFNDRVDADGKKVLFIEEVQSDWHQKGRKEGYADPKRHPELAEKVSKAGADLRNSLVPFRPEDPPALNRERMDNRMEWIKQRVDRQIRSYPNDPREGDQDLAYSHYFQEEERPALLRYMAARREQMALERGAVPNAPFKTTWHELALKRMLRYASENGYDKLAWTTGEQQAERYDLSKQVDELHYNPETWRLTANKGGQRVMDEQSVRPEKLADYVDKDVAQKLIDQPPNDNGLRSLRGADLKVGGQGMKGFYDKILPDFLNKYGKKWNARVGETKIATRGLSEFDRYTYNAYRNARIERVGEDWRWLSPDGEVPPETFSTEEQARDDLRSRIEKFETIRDRSAAVHSIDITPAMRDSVLYEGQPLFNRGKKGQAGTGIRFDYTPPEGSEPPRLTLSREAMEAVRTAGGIARFTGASLSRGEALTYAQNLEEKPETEALALALRRARDEAGHAGVIAITEGAPDHVYREERFHAGQREIAGPNLDVHLGNDAVKRLTSEHPDYLHFDWKLQRMGYGSASGHEKVLEIGAKIAAGEPRFIEGIPEDAQVRWMKSYFSELVAQHGREKVAGIFPKMYDRARQFYERYEQDVEAGAIQRGSGIGEKQLQQAAAGISGRPNGPPESREGDQGNVARTQKAQEPDLGGLLSKEEPPETTGFEPGSMRVTIPGAGAAAKQVGNFYKQDIEPVVKGVPGGLKEVVKMGLNVIAPRMTAPQQSLDVAMKMKGQREKERFRFERTMAATRKMFDQMPEADRIRFIDNIMRGRNQATPELDQVAQALRQIQERFRAQEKVFRPDLADKENYFHLKWKKLPAGVDEDGNIIAGTGGEEVYTGPSHRPLQGGRSFMKRKTLPDASTGIARGGELISTNPVDLVQHRVEESLKFTTARKAWEEHKSTPYTVSANGRILHIVQFFKKGQNQQARALGYDKLDDPIAKVMFPAESGEGMIEPGEYWVEANTARLYNNFLSRDLIREKKVGRGIVALKNGVTAWKLGFSPFHLITESMLAMGSEIGRGYEHMWNEGIRKGSLPEIGRGIWTAVKAVGAPYGAAREGGHAVRYVSDPNEFLNAHGITGKMREGFIRKYPEVSELLSDMFTGGAKLAMHEDFRMNALQGLRQAAADNNYIGALVRSPMALNQTIQYPLFEVYIPRLKVGMFLREYSEALADREEELDSGRLNRAKLARDVWDGIDHRFGELNWDNLFWNRTFKTANQLLWRAFSWTYGNFKFVQKATTGQAQEIWQAGKYWKDAYDHTAGTAGQKSKPGTSYIPRLDRNMAKILGMATVGVAVHTLLQFYFTRKLPKDYKDLIAPEDGTLDKNGQPNRWTAPLVPFKDIESAANSPTHYVRGKFADIWTAIPEAINNRDFQNHLISHPSDPEWEQLFDRAAHVVGAPIGAQKFMQEKKQGSDTETALLGTLGISRAAKSTTQTSAEKKMHEIRASHFGPMTDEELEAREQKDQRIAAGNLTRQERQRARNEAHKNEFEKGMEQFNYAQVREVYDLANDDEKSMMRRILLQKRFPRTR